MNSNSINTIAAAMAALTLHLPAADFVKGYTKDAASQLLESNNPGAGGEILFVDQAEIGGNDLTADAGNPDWGFSIAGSASWGPGDAVTFTGLAVPVWADDPDTVATSNTQNASWKIRFYSAGVDGEWNGQNNLATTDDSFIGDTIVQFTSAGAGTDEYYVSFDTPITWTSDSPKIWFYIQALNSKAMRLKTGPSGAAAVREVRTSGAAVSSNTTFAMSLAGTVTSSVTKGTPLEWTPTGPGDGASLYQEANWINPIDGTTPPAATVDPNVALDRSLIIRAGSPGGGAGAGGNLLLGSGDLTISRATLRMSKGSSSGIDMGTHYRNLSIEDGRVLTHSITNGSVVMRGYSDLTLYGSDPLAITTIDLQSPDCFVYFLDRLPSVVEGEDLSKFTVNGVAAVKNSNVQISQYYNGTVIRPNIPGGIAMKGFDQADLAGTAWNFTTGFKGRVGLGLSAFNAGSYTIDGWGTDIWDTGDECHFVYREMTGDGEIIAKVNSVQNTNFSAKAGIMIRESLSDDSKNAYIFERPNNTVLFQKRTTTGGSTSSSGVVGGTTNDQWIRLVREGNNFSGFFSTVSATGPWTSVGSGDITMSTTVYVGLAATSHIGVERGTSVFSDVSTIPASSGTLGVFTDTMDIEADWIREDQISSFLLKKGYMVTVSTDGGGQGASKVYVATEADLKVNLPAEFDNKISFMRVLPWRWVAKKGWCGAANVYPAVIEAHWKYEWEPTGASTSNWEFVPMIKGAGQDADYRWEEVRVRGGQTHFLGFNEPNLTSQGNLTVDEAIALWPKAQQLGLRLGSPAPTDNAAGDAWLEDFMTKANAKGYRVDCICLHNYAAKTGTALKNWLDAKYAKYGLPVWLTEFQRETNDNPTVTDHETFLTQALPILEDLGYLERYSYYNFNTATPSNSYASLFNGDDTVNSKGQLYLNVFSNPSYVNSGQPAWGTASLDFASGGILQPSNGGVITASTSISPASVSGVEFFVNGVSVGGDTTFPYQLPVSSLGLGLQSVYSVVSTTFGETIVSPATQVHVTEFKLLAPSLGPGGQISWAAVPGELYRFQTTNDLANPHWDVLETRIATGFVETAADPAWGTDAKRFYRIAW